MHWNLEYFEDEVSLDYYSVSKSPITQTDLLKELTVDMSDPKSFKKITMSVLL